MRHASSGFFFFLSLVHVDKPEIIKPLKAYLSGLAKCESSGLVEDIRRKLFLKHQSHEIIFQTKKENWL